MKFLNANRWLIALTSLSAIATFDGLVALLFHKTSWPEIVIVSIGAVASGLATYAAITGRYLTVWISSLVALIGLADNVAFYLSLAASIVALVQAGKQSKRKGYKVLLRSAPILLYILGLLGFVGPILLSALLVPIQCPASANEANCAPAALPWMTLLTAPLGIVLVIVGLIVQGLKNRDSGSN
ncbi:MAG: hypothetical protein ACKOOE_07230 [Micrococcales bacterium]